MNRINFVSILALVLLAAFALPAFGQTNLQNFAAAGISYNAGGSPALAGTGLYAHSIADSATYAFTVIDALPDKLPDIIRAARL